MNMNEKSFSLSLMPMGTKSNGEHVNTKVYPTVVFAFENHLKWKSYSNNVESSLFHIIFIFSLTFLFRLSAQLGK